MWQTACMEKSSGFVLLPWSHGFQKPHVSHIWFEWECSWMMTMKMFNLRVQIHSSLFRKLPVVSKFQTVAWRCRYVKFLCPENNWWVNPMNVWSDLIWLEQIIIIRWYNKKSHDIDQIYLYVYLYSMHFFGLPSMYFYSSLVAIVSTTLLTSNWWSFFQMIRSKIHSLKLT